MDASIHHILALGASHDPDAVALRTSDGAVWLYRTLASSTKELAAEIARRGVPVGGRVAVVCENGAAGVIALFAASLAGCIVIPINARLTSAEIEHIEQEASPDLWIYTTGESQAAAVHAMSAGAAPFHLPHSPAIDLRQAMPESVEPAAPGTALILFTSGTTGRPKGVMHSATAVTGVAAAERVFRDIRQSDRIFCPLPLAHMFGLTSLLMPYLSGGACVELTGRFDAETVLTRLSTGEITHFFGVPSIYAALLAAAENSGLRPQGLIAARTGGASIDPTLAERAADLLGVPLANGYGTTEISPICTTRGGPGLGVGRPAAGAEICIVESSGIAASTGSEGEIWARGPHRMLGYYAAKDATNAVTRPGGWYATGDLGRVDENGNLHIVGRIKDVINRSGFNVYPAEIEMALSRHPKVARCAVVGLPSGNDEEVVAIVEPRGILTPPELADHARTQLTGYKRPNRYLMVDSLPVGPTGKIVKAALIAMAGDAISVG